MEQYLDKHKTVMEMITNLEEWNSHEVRKKAAIDLANLGSYNKLAIDALTRHVVKTYNHDLKNIFNEALDAICFLKNNDSSLESSKTLTLITTVNMIEKRGPGLHCHNTKSYCRCSFCEKETPVSPRGKLLSQILLPAGANRFYCNFCLRHKFYQRDSKDILILSFRGILGYYYYSFYALTKSPLMFISEINDYIDLHVKIGSQNPVFFYDNESYLWFVDFSRIGSDKVPIRMVLNTISEILMSFNLLDHVKDIKPHKLYLKYEEAIIKFNDKRTRPETGRILSPTLMRTGASEYSAEKITSTTYTSYGVNSVNDSKRKISFEETRDFTPEMLKNYRKY
jgi:hypothetical protein